MTAILTVEQNNVVQNAAFGRKSKKFNVCMLSGQISGVVVMLASMYSYICP